MGFFRRKDIEGNVSHSSLPTGKTRRLPTWSDRTPTNAPLTNAPPGAGVTSMFRSTSVRTQLPSTINLPSETEIPAPTVIVSSTDDKTTIREKPQQRWGFTWKIRWWRLVICVWVSIYSRGILASSPLKIAIAVPKGFGKVLILRNSCSESA